MAVVENLPSCKDQGEVMIDLFGVKRSTVAVKGNTLL